MGAAPGDYDGDGRIDLLVTGFRDQRLYRNLGHGRFEDVTRSAGLQSDRWSTSAAFADLDGDGDLDLYVASYVEYDPGTAPYCAAPDGRRDYCGPEDFAAEVDRLYRNDGDGTFTDVTSRSGIAKARGRGLGVLIAELTGDHLPDIYVANDGDPCFLFANRGDLRFEEMGQTLGVARDGNGVNLSGMGIALGDLAGDRQLDLVVTNFLGRSTVLFEALRQQDGSRHYHGVGATLGVASATRPVLGFGIAIEDFDGDGWMDLAQVNGHVLDRARLGVPMAMRSTLLKGTRGRLVDVSASAGDWFVRPRLGRGLAVGDLDADGRPDLIVGALDTGATILRNESAPGRFVILELRDARGRPLVGTVVRARVGGREILRQVIAGGSYLSASQPRLFVGLGDAEQVDQVDVTWPWKTTTERWTRLRPRRIHQLQPGQGE
jgi:hypothetical protein